MFVLKTIFSLIFCLFPVWGAAQDALPGKAKTDAVAIPLANDSVSQYAVFDGRKYAADYPDAELDFGESFSCSRPVWHQI